jgi:hypothetical protein
VIKHQSRKHSATARVRRWKTVRLRTMQCPSTDRGSRLKGAARAAPDRTRGDSLEWDFPLNGLQICEEPAITAKGRKSPTTAISERRRLLI